MKPSLARPISGLNRARQKAQSFVKGKPKNIPKKRGRRPNGRLLRFLPFMLAPGLVSVLWQGDFQATIAILVGFLSLVAGAWFVRRGITQEIRMEAGLVTLPSRLPNKLIGAIFYGFGLFAVSAFTAQFGMPMGLVYGLLCAGAVIARYGLDAKIEKTEAHQRAEQSGINFAQLLADLEQARGRVEVIRSNAYALPSRAQQNQGLRIANSADAVLDQIEQDPKDIRASRKFMVSYLKRAEHIFTTYVERAQKREDGHANNKDWSSIENKFREALDDLEKVFAEQNQKLSADEDMDLEIKLDVLSQRLRHEGAG